jgi:outer membrane protein OmpA-like peptidoglycan-associated protein
MNRSKNSHRYFAPLAAAVLPFVLMTGCSEDDPATESATPYQPSRLYESIDAGKTVPVADVVTTAAPDDESAPLGRILYFDTDKDAVASADVNLLQQHAAFLVSHPRYVLQINGHADERGLPAYNTELGSRRAREVAKVLVAYGVAEGQLQLQSFGEDMPANDLKNWNENRRVELIYSDTTLLSAR